MPLCRRRRHRHRGCCGMGRGGVVGTIHTPSFLIYSFVIVIVAIVATCGWSFVLLYCLLVAMTSGHVRMSVVEMTSSRSVACIFICVRMCVYPTRIEQVYATCVTFLYRRHTPCSTNILVKELILYMYVYVFHNLGLPALYLLY